MGQKKQKIAKKGLAKLREKEEEEAKWGRKGKGTNVHRSPRDGATSFANIQPPTTANMN